FTMGDMKTPDFDDLLAAFDIPDIDAKEAIQSGGSGAEDGQSSGLRPGVCEDSSDASGQGGGCQDGGAVSVIVRHPRSLEHGYELGTPGGKEGVTSEHAHNGFAVGAAVSIGLGFDDELKEPGFCQFSPISSVEEGEIEDDDDDEEDTEDEEEEVGNGNVDGDGLEQGEVKVARESLLPEKVDGDGDQVLDCLDDLVDENNTEVSKMSTDDETSGSTAQMYSKPAQTTSTKLSSCIEAIAALNAKKAESGCRDVSRASGKSGTESPHSVCSETSSKGSPAPSSLSGCGSPPAIPKVRIRTIKTSSGEITRTVTRVLPDFDQDSGVTALHKIPEVSFSPITEQESPSGYTSPSETQLAKATIIAGVTEMVSVATPESIPSSTATTMSLGSSKPGTPSQVINIKFADNTTVKATVLSPVSNPNSSVASASVQAAASHVMLQVKHLPFLLHKAILPKTVQLAGLSLVPQAATLGTATMVTRGLIAPAQHVLRKVVASGQLGGAQNTVVEAFNRLLNSANPVPLYLPNLNPPASTGITLPATGHRCSECGDSFALEASLARHYARRSLRIEVTCNHCSRGARSLVFYNKCSLLSHARQHKERGVVMQCSHLVMRPLPIGQLSVILNMCGVINSPDGAGPVAAALPLHDDPMRLTRYSSRCLECSQQFVDGTALAKHFQLQDDGGSQTCQVCQMLLPNKCSYAAHTRIHQHKSPYTCPECGAVCRSSHFQTHIKEICLHFARKVGFRCVHCGLIFAELGTLKTHIQGTHCEVFYKCPLCPMAFKSGPSTRSHAFTQHSGVKVGESKIIYKCSMCDTVFTQQALLYSHFDTHVAKRKVCVFKCPDCTLLFAQKPLMLDHVKRLASTKRKCLTDISSCPSSHQDTTNEVEVAERMAGANARTETRRPTPSRRLRLKNAGWTCTECQNRFVEREVYVSHMKRVHGKPVKKYPCRQCDRSFSSSHSLRRHIRINHEGIRKVYTCWYCTDHARTFTKRFMLENHIRLMHGIKDPDFSQMPGGPGGLDESESVCQVGNEKWSQLLSFGGDTAGTAERPYVCAKCEYTTESREDFQRHIPQHRSEGVAWQCSECGLCFTSQPSLGRHLFIVHLQDFKKNGRGEDRNGGESTTSLEHSSAIAGTNGTGCSVCGKTFENEGALNTHLRTHGMAFIRAKRAGTVEK
uniref:Zinc finger protein 532 n=1 Tax=Eptatretus burgeri TaxID=7764 RepID=A0A8C4NIN4_EPTBU